MDDANNSMLDPIAADSPALVEALEISKAAVSVGFEWQTIKDVWDKVFEEIDELKEAYAQGSVPDIQLELGDVLFSLVNIARKMEVDAEESLHLTNDKFRKRWHHMEQAASKAGISLEDCSQNQLEELWQQAKISLRSQQEKTLSEQPPYSRA